MRFSNLISLYRLRLRSMFVQELLAITGIAVGVALVFAALIANTSLTGSIRQLTDSVVGGADFQLASRSGEGFDGKLLDRVQRLPGVETAAPILDVRANVVGPEGERSLSLIGGDARFVELARSLAADFSVESLSRQRAVALPTPLAAELGLALGQRMSLEINGRTVSIPLGIQLQERDIGDLVNSPIALAPLAYAQQLAGRPGRVTRIFVNAEQGRERTVEAGLRRIAGGRLNVGSGDADREVFERAAYPSSQSTTLFTGLSALVGFLFAFSAVLLTVPQRSRLMMDLRMAGHEGWALLQLLLFDAFVLGVAASIVGLLLGEQLSRHLFGATPEYLSTAFAVGSQRIVTWQSIVLASGSGFLAACLAVLVPLREMIQRHPLAEPAPSRAGGATAAIAIGIGCIGITTAVILLIPDAALIGLVSLTAALLCLLPGALRMTTRVFQTVTRGWRTPVPTLATVELTSRETRSRSLALAATGAVAAFAVVAIGGAHGDLERGLNESARTLDSNADIWVTLAGSSNALATTEFDNPDALIAVLRRAPGIEEVRSYRGAFLDVGDYRAWVVAMPRAASAPLADGQLVEGEAARANARIGGRGWVVLSESIAAELRRSIGDVVTLPSPAPQQLRIAAISNNLGWPPGAIVLNADDYAAAWGTAAVSGLHVDVEEGASPVLVKREIEQRIGPRTPLEVETTSDRIARHYGTAADSLTRLTQISGLVLIAAVLAMTITMAGMIWQRRTTFAYLKVAGFSQRDLWSALMVEGGVLLGTGCAAGALFGLYGQLLLSRALAAITGFPVAYVVAVPTMFLTLALLMVVVLGMLVLPGWLAVRVRPSPNPSG